MFKLFKWTRAFLFLRSKSHCIVNNFPVVWSIYLSSSFVHLMKNPDSLHHLIIVSRHQRGYPWPSLATPPNRPLLPAVLQDYIPYLHRPAVFRFELIVLPLLGHVKGSTGVHPLWVRPYFSSSVPHVWFV